MDNVATFKSNAERAAERAEEEKQKEMNDIRQRVESDMVEDTDQQGKTVRITQSMNFIRIFEMPEKLPTGFCFGGGRPSGILLVDWFQPLCSYEAFGLKGVSRDYTGEELIAIRKSVKEFVRKKRYIRGDRLYFATTAYGDIFFI